MGRLAAGGRADGANNLGSPHTVSSTLFVWMCLQLACDIGELVGI